MSIQYIERPDRAAMERDVVLAWGGLPIPEMIGGAIVGALFLLAVVTVPPTGLRGVGDVPALIVGAIAGAVASYFVAPRHLVLDRTARRDTPERQHLRRVA